MEIVILVWGAMVVIGFAVTVIAILRAPEEKFYGQYDAGALEDKHQ